MPSGHNPAQFAKSLKSVTETYTITVADTNEAPTAITLDGLPGDALTLADGQTELGALAVVDADTAPSHYVFSLLADTDALDNEDFTITDGTLSFTAATRKQAGESYQVGVQVADYHTDPDGSFLTYDEVLVVEVI